MSKTTNLPWRVGDAGMTIFGPKNGMPSPETIAHIRKADNTRLIVRSVNSHESLLSACKHAAEIIRGGDRMETLEPWAQELCAEFYAAIAKTEQP